MEEVRFFLGLFIGLLIVLLIALYIVGYAYIKRDNFLNKPDNN